MNHRCLGALVMLAVAGTAAAEPSSYVCTVKKAAGLHFDSHANEWMPTTFKSGGKYILRRLTEDDLKTGKYRGLLKLPGEPIPNWAFFDGEMPEARCVETTGRFAGFNCHGLGMSAEFDPDSRRFEFVHRGGYLTQAVWLTWKREDPAYYRERITRDHLDGAINPDDLFIEIGHCSPDQ